MGTIRITKQKNFSIISNRHLNDFTLSFKAKGILTYLLSKPDDWTLYVTQLIKSSREGREAVYSGISELVDAGYIIKQQCRNQAGQMAGIEYIVMEDPINADNPGTVLPNTENPNSVNRELLKTDKNNNGSKTKTDNNIKPVKSEPAITPQLTEKEPLPLPSLSSLELTTTISALIALVPESFQSNSIKSLIKRSLCTHSEAYIKQSIQYTNNHSTGQTEGKYKAFLGKAIENGWGEGYEPDDTGQIKETKIREVFKVMPIQDLKILATTGNKYAQEEMEKRC